MNTYRFIRSSFDTFSAGRYRSSEMRELSEHLKQLRAQYAKLNNVPAI
jgi:hypothetical protein